MMTDQHYYPALMLDRLTPVYDLFVRLLLREKWIKSELIANAQIAPGHRVLDLGAGTGSLAIMIKRAQPEAQVTGLDVDPTILTIAREKAARSGAKVTFELGNVVELPYADQSFDRVVTSLVFSLLTSSQKQQAAVEAHRVLTQGGELLIADFGPPHTRWGRLLAHRMRRFAPISDLLEGRLPELLRNAGFTNVQEIVRFATMLGTVSILSGYKREP